MATRQHAIIDKFDPDKLLHVVRGGHTEHFLPSAGLGKGECSGQIWRYEHDHPRAEVCLDAGDYGFEAVVRGTFRPGFLCLGRVQYQHPAGEGSTLINGAAVSSDQLQIYPEDVEFFYHARPGTAWAALQVRREDLQRTSQALLGRTLDLSPRRIANLTIGPRSRAVMVELTWAALRPDGPPSFSVSAREREAEDAFFADVVLEVAAEVIDIAQRDEAFDEHQIRIHQRLELVRRAQDLMRLNIAAPYDSLSLCAALGVPERTLQLAFQRTFAMSPSRWLHRARLHEARRLLRRASPASDTVAAIAARCGLTHAGRFSREYARLFGEAPSVTLRCS